METTPPFLKTIEWEMMNKKKFFPLSMLSSFSVRCALFPLTVIKTQLQVQFKNDVYKGMFDCGTKIYKAEGLRGLYRGFWISSFQIISGVFYISTYEGVRHLLTQRGFGANTKAIVAGGAASLVGQTIIVPFDVISQHIMVLGMNAHGIKHGAIINPLGISEDLRKSQLAIQIAKEIFKRDGIGGYYRGYTASLLAYVPNSALWWGFYHLYQDELIKLLPTNTSHLFIQCLAGSLGGFTTTIITNPLDIIRARLQVQRLDSFARAAIELWAEEHIHMFFKGLSARLVQSAAFSFSIILGYETIKRISVNEQYKHMVKW
ncbi:hypothetical protein PVAND_004099 [Polypedilum vanderplanki]|uniref:Mitochondrial carrier protein n=1 Tax=Polypedilum vanderplanki TaxID=319348 RepID=A0A9J6BWK4_POLVA|nr:hypothetical protein PVAND_004099 [Polypedilum vanderplanki]